MAKLRVYEVAKHLNMDQKTLVELFQSMGIGDVRNHMSAVESDVVERVTRHLERQKIPAIIKDPGRPAMVRRDAGGANGQGQTLQVAAKRGPAAQESTAVSSAVAPQPQAARHYVHFSSSALVWLNIAPDGVRDAATALADMVSGGKLRCAHVPPGTKGPRIRVFGACCMYEAVMGHRADTLTVYAVFLGSQEVPADSLLHPVALLMSSTAPSAELDAVAYLFVAAPRQNGQWQEVDVKRTVQPRAAAPAATPAVRPEPRPPPPSPPATPTASVARPVAPLASLPSRDQRASASAAPPSNTSNGSSKAKTEAAKTPSPWASSPGHASPGRVETRASPPQAPKSKSESTAQATALHPSEGVAPGLVTVPQPSTESPAQHIGWPAEPGQRLLPAPTRELVDRWALHGAGVNESIRRTIESTLRRHARSLESVANRIDRVDGCIDAVRLVSEFVLEAKGWMALLPLAPDAQERLLQQRGEAEQAYLDARQHVDEAALAALLPDIAPATLREIAELFRARDVWQQLPEWWWTFMESLGPAVQTTSVLPGSNGLWLQRFLAAPARNLTRSTCQSIRDGLEGRGYEALKSLPGPPPGVDPEEHITSEVNRLIKVRMGYDGAVARYGGTLLDLERRGVIDPEHLSDLAHTFDGLEDRVAAAVHMSMARWVACAADRHEVHQRVWACRKVLDECTRLMGAAHTPLLSWSVMEPMLQKIGPPPSDRIELSIEAVFTTAGAEPRAHPPLFFWPSPDDPVHGTVRVPVALITGKRVRLHAALQYADGGSKLRSGWPGQWGDVAITPARIEIEEAQWHDADKGVNHTLSVVIPVRRPQPNDALSIEIELVDPATSTVLSRKTLTWKRFAVETESPDGKPTIHLDWTTAEAPEYAKDHPVGPQKASNQDEILERIRNGNSFAVTAPRRFGKSTLIAYLESTLRERCGALPLRANCAEHHRGEATAFGHEGLWGDVSRQLFRRIKVGLPHDLDGGSPPLPRGDDFSGVRRMAKQAGLKSIVVLFDEAQLLFQGTPSLDYTSRLRTLLTTHLGARTDESMVPVVFGFIGLPSLNRERLGADFHPYLNPIAHATLDEDDLLKIIRRVTRGTLQTTREARERMVRVANNLYILRTVLDRVRARARDDHRLWASVDDVLEVEHQLRGELRAGKDPAAIETYIRDALNDSPSPDSWRPIAAYPVALALALALNEGMRGQEAIGWIERVLERWCERLFDKEVTRPAYDRQAIEEHLRTLTDMNLLDRGRFVSEFLEAHLVGQAPALEPRDAVELRRALVCGGMPTVHLPGDLTERGAGAQSRIATFTDAKKRVIAARRTVLHTDEERVRFLDDLSMLERLKRLHDGNHPGAECIVKLIDCGLLARTDKHVAVHAYHWIEGVDLETKRGSLLPDVVVTLGQSLARAVFLLHETGILHRDIRPKNVILQHNQLFPVLIDFGFARVRERPGDTPLADPLAAPEVQGATPRWDKPADVFALAATLDTVLAPDRALQPDARPLAGRLRTELRAYCALDPNQRGTTSDLVELLEGLAREFKLQGKIDDFFAGLQAKVAKDTHPKRYEKAIQHCRPDIEGFALGLYRTVQERAGKIADFVNKLMEANNFGSIGQFAHSQYGHGGWPPGIQILLGLRNAQSHIDARTVVFDRDTFVAGIALIERDCGFSALPQIATQLLGRS